MKLPKMAWIARHVLAELYIEANRTFPDETGGVLLGYLSERDNEPVVTHSIGPGSSATHERHRFIPDHTFQETEIARLYAESDARLHYLGDWHTHPRSSAELSPKDTATLKLIANHKQARIHLPMMLILGYGPEWQPVAWIGYTSTARLWRRTFKTQRLRISIYDD